MLAYRGRRCRTLVHGGGGEAGTCRHGRLGSASVPTRRAPARRGAGRCDRRRGREPGDRCSAQRGLREFIVFGADGHRRRSRARCRHRLLIGAMQPASANVRSCGLPSSRRGVLRVRHRRRRCPRCEGRGRARRARRADTVDCADVVQEYFPQCRTDDVLVGHGFSDADLVVEPVPEGACPERLETITSGLDAAFTDQLGDGAVRVIGVGTRDPTCRVVAVHLAWTAGLSDGQRRAACAR